ncbi:MAG: DUF4012 domain-containing protein [Candidatus Peribacteraceae bacterium]|nr:DUF4012 domain-containing protein [Candidatus Peribacteraceae bacterium]
MFFQKLIAKLHPKKKKIWRWILIAIVAFFALLVLIVELSVGELGDLGVRKITGFPFSKNYLVVFQNDAERRPTGGFITSFATLKFRFGIPFFQFGNVYDEKLIQKETSPPDPFVEDLLAGDFYPGHGFRDGNLDPDFPTSARELIRLYQLGYPEAEFDGVIAIDFTAFQNLAEELSPEIGGPAGLFAALENQIQNIDLHDPEQIQDRKNFLGDVAKNLIKKIILHPKASSSVLLESLNSKHILFYFLDSDIEATVLAKNWGGALPAPVDSDLLAIVEGNYGGMKSSRYITRDIFYDIEFSEDAEQGLTATAKLKIQLAHRGDAAEPISGYYKSVWRVFTPLGSQKISGTLDQIFDDGSRKVFTKTIEMNPGESREINFSYLLPESTVQDNIYNLKLVKQSGSSADHVRVTVKLPAGFLLASDDFDARENLAIFETNLDSDKDLALRIIPDTQPPRLAWQEFIGRNLATIDLRFNEPLDLDSIKSATFSLADMNYRNQRFDSVKIRRAIFIPPQDVWIEVSGVTPECREWYELRFNGIADQHGNFLRDQKVTVVQWIDEFGQNCDPNREL